MSRFTPIHFLIACSLFLLASCGARNDSVAGGGIGGTGKGKITSATAGSITINHTRTFEVMQTTGISVDGVPVSEAELQATATGLVVQVHVGVDVSDDFTSGTALEILGETLVKGPVTGTDPLRVLGQTVVVTSDTALPGTVIADLVKGDIVEVSGFANDNNVIKATRVEYKSGGIPVWKLTGPVSNPVPGVSFTIGNQQVNHAGITPKDCDGGLADGDYVEVKAAEDPLFTAGDPLTTVTGVECETPGLELPGGVGGTLLKAEMEGLVDSIVSTNPLAFILSGQMVVTDGNTVYEDGSELDVVVGANLEAEGVLDTTTGVLTAKEIEFQEPAVRIEGPVNSSTDIDKVLEILTILQIPVQVTPLTRDDDGIMSTWTGVEQLEVRGFTDSLNQVYATEIRIKSPTPSDIVRLRGPVTGIPGQPVFDILGVHVDTTGVTQLHGLNEELLNEDQFFAILQTGFQVDVEGGTYNDATNKISAANAIEIED